MTSSIESYIQAQWQDELVPIIDGILFDNGDILLFDYEPVPHTDAEHGDRTVHFKQKTTLVAFLEESPDMWTMVIEMASAVWHEGGVKVTCGEGGFGSDGFVAACRMADEHLLWVAFFQRSNPFHQVEIRGTDVLATSTHGLVWIFPLSNPAQVRVQGGEEE